MRRVALTPLERRAVELARRIASEAGAVTVARLAAALGCHWSNASEVYHRLRSLGAWPAAAPVRQPRRGRHG